MKFDIILPSINRPSLITAVQSVVDQTYKDWHLYVIGDGFQPTPGDPLHDLIAYQSPKITFISIVGPNNDWGTKARNVGIKNGHGDWLAFIDDDDRWLEHHLATIADLSANFDMVRTAGQEFKFKHKHPRTKEMVKKLGQVNYNDVLCVGMSFSRVIFNKTSGFGSRDGHDAVLWQEMLGLGGLSRVSDIVTFEFER